MPAPSTGDTTTRTAPENLAAPEAAEFVTTLTRRPVRAMAERLTGRGLRVRTTACDDSRLLKVTRPRKAACDVIVANDQYFTCEYTAKRNRRSNPADLARIVARMLCTDYTSPQQYAHLHRGATLAGAVARDLKARGMTVTLSVAEDDETYTVFADIIITSPARPERGKVILDDSGWIYWECYGDDIPGGPADLADTVADILTHDGRITAGDRLAVLCSACLRAITYRHSQAADTDSDNRRPCWPSSLR
jgi:hypothetical protein